MTTCPPGLPRLATTDDAEALAALVNAAFRVEDFFKVGDRTDVADIREHLARGEFLVLDEDPAATRGSLAACVYVERNGTHAYFGMLSVAPTQQGRGLGRFLIESLEDRCRAAGCTEVGIHVINLRQDLWPFYRRFGYVETGTLPFPDDGSTTRPCHMVVMTKSL
jgi:GNAT superfamily N-acetyltransferase